MGLRWSESIGFTPKKARKSFLPCSLHEESVILIITHVLQLHTDQDLPARTIFFFPSFSRWSWSSVPVKELGCVLWITYKQTPIGIKSLSHFTYSALHQDRLLPWSLHTFSPSLGISSSNSSASSVPGVNSGAPSGVLCFTCTTSPPASRYFCSTAEMFARDSFTLEIARRPWSYSF